jgi:ABC-type Na+ efflux pump permease subunit
VIAGLSWFGLSAFTHLDSEGAKQARMQLGLERGDEVCSTKPGASVCSFDDRAQARVDEEWRRDVRIRSAILQELSLRLIAVEQNLEVAEDLLARQEFDFGNGMVAGGDVRLGELLIMPDISPLRWKPIYADGHKFIDLTSAGTWDPNHNDSPEATRKLLGLAIDEVQAQVDALQVTLGRQEARELELEVSNAFADRNAAIIDMQINPSHRALTLSATAWFEHGVAEEVSRSALNLANAYSSEFSNALNPEANVWAGGWEVATSVAQHPPTLRYRSPVSDSTRARLAGVLFLALAAFVFVVVSPVVTATATAREREAGTLPVLRMTGMSADDLALAMVLGPNVFSLALGGSLLLTAMVLLAATLPLTSVLLPVALLVVLAGATHLTAIGLGDALGQRVNAMVVGGLLGVAIVVPGLVGLGLAASGVASTGLLLGPLPALLASAAELSQVKGIGLSFELELTEVMLTYSVTAQAMLALVCLASWRRRVEQGWAPLFRPIDGVLLAVLSIGCSALTLLDISYQHQAQDFNALNLLTLLSSAFLLPVLAWLLVASLRRPARARAVADHIETRRAFVRFQGFVAVTGLLVGLAYNFVMHSAGLATSESEVMWATLTQVLLVAETGVATLLWSSRRRDDKLRIAFVGGAVVVMQLLSVFGTYGLEVSHVAINNAPAMPLLLNAQISPYWLGFLVLCWAAGMALIFTALMRRRDEQAQAKAQAAQAQSDDDDDDFGMPGRRLIH